MRHLLAGAIAMAVFASAAAQNAPLTLEQIMADPDWIGAPIDLPEPFEDRGGGPHFSVDGKSVYYRAKRSGSAIRDQHRIDLGDGKDSVVDAAAMAAADGEQVTFDPARVRAAFVRNGDVFVRELASGHTIQVTRTTTDETGPQFSADGRKLSWHVGTDWFVYDVAGGIATQAALLKTDKDPDAAPAKADDLRDLQLRLFTTLKKARDDKRATREHAEQLQQALSSPAGSRRSFSRRMSACASRPHSRSTKGAMLRPVPCSALSDPSYFPTTIPASASMKPR